MPTQIHIGFCVNLSASVCVSLGIRQCERTMIPYSAFTLTEIEIDTGTDKIVCITVHTAERRRQILLSMSFGSTTIFSVSV